MVLDSFAQRICDEYSELSEDNESDSFELEHSLNENTNIVFTGRRNNSDRWGENQHAIDAEVDVMVSDVDDWSDVLDELDEFTDELKAGLRKEIGFNGPITLRQVGDPCTRSWTRRVIRSSA